MSSVAEFRCNRTTSLLVLLNLVLGATIAVELQLDMAVAPGASAATTSSELGPKPKLPKFEPPPREHFAGVVDRPLFEPSRRPYVPSKMAPPPTPDVEDVAITLIGTFLSQARRLALVKLGSQEGPITVHEGELLSSWRIERILSDSLLLRRNDQTRTVFLYPDPFAQRR